MTALMIKLPTTLMLIASLLWGQHAWAAKSYEEKVFFLPSSWSGELETTLFLPTNTPPPYPLIIVSHGKAEGDPKDQDRYRYVSFSRAMTRLGYAVAIPMREGFANSSGWHESSKCDIYSYGLREARSLKDAVDYFIDQPEFEDQPMYIFGNSVGGIVTMAYGTNTRIPKRVKALFNIAGGVLKASGGCILNQAMTDAMGKFAPKVTLPNLWIYDKSDELFPPIVARGMHLNFEKSSPSNSELIIMDLGSKIGGHKIFNNRKAIKVWWPHAEKLLTSVTP